MKLDCPLIHIHDNVALSPVDAAANVDVIFDKQDATYIFKSEKSHRDTFETMSLSRVISDALGVLLVASLAVLVILSNAFLFYSTLLLLKLFTFNLS